MNRQTNNFTSISLLNPIKQKNDPNINVYIYQSFHLFCKILLCEIYVAVICYAEIMFLDFSDGKGKLLEVYTITRK